MKYLRFAGRHWPSTLIVVTLLVLLMIPHSIERFFVYFPIKEIPEDPSSRGLEFEEVWLNTRDGVKIHGWFIPFSGSTLTVLIFHGNAGNIGHRVFWIEQLRQAEANFLIIDYRGYGRSEGKPHEQGLYQDAEAAYAWWRERRPHEGEKLVLLGESLGGAIAVDLASKFPVDGLILQSTFTSAWDMAKTMLPLGLLQPLTGVRFDSAAKIQKIECPKLFIHGDRDNIVPYRLGKKLFELSRMPKDLHTVPGAGHNDLIWVGGAEYQDTITRFLQQYRRVPG